MMIPLWMFIVSLIVFAGMLIREIIINNQIKKQYDVFALFLGYMIMRFDYKPTWEDIENQTGIKEKMEELIKEQEGSK